MNQDLIIRADANNQIGTGHVMRCIALAQAWRDSGGNVTFASHCNSKALRQRIDDEGFKFISIEKPCPDPHDLRQTIDEVNIRNTKHDTWLVLDGYHFTSDYQKAIRDNGIKLLVIDDMAHLRQYHADILLNQNISASHLSYSCDRNTVKLLGPEYALLRKEFLQYSGMKPDIPDKAKKILITMGGSDADNTTLKVIRTLNSMNDSNLEIRIVVGPANPNIDVLEDALLSAACSMRIYRNATNMPDLMAWSDLALTAAGSTCWELAFMGVPSLTVVTGKNQQDVASGLSAAGIFKTLGWCNELSNKILISELTTHMQDKQMRRTISRLGQQLIDGKGARKVLYALLEQHAQKK